MTAGSDSTEDRVYYFFGNARNEKGLCATPDCDGKPVHTFMYKYCDKCHDTIMSDLVAGRAPNIARIENREAVTIPEEPLP